ncbi:ACT domain-containing protein [Poritiphilus flavus]|uniref:ACT domain-containing protein n=1 Tax=Poritiphilus flavus TaxID=2697053 RepID=A0A6L9EH95_9FLAO|nr:ACT domain-containing protein [Poritiphilus flavus]NAS14081.1 ACT domain-containing protein [Poritiphilus flavus]
MNAETSLSELISGMTPQLNPGEYVFISTRDISSIPRDETICEFREKEAHTVVISRKKAEEMGHSYEYVASWITLMIHSSLEAVGFTAVFSAELAKHGISCNVIAGYYHDHIFVNKKEAEKAMRVLTNLSKNYH